MDDRQNGVEQQIELARLLVARLERLSADSYWAHQASGVRGSLLRALGQVDHGEVNSQAANSAGLENRLTALNESGFKILLRAAVEKTPHRLDAFRPARRNG